MHKVEYISRGGVYKVNHFRTLQCQLISEKVMNKEELGLPNGSFGSYELYKKVDWN
jgi:hypothetical protein